MVNPDLLSKGCQLCQKGKWLCIFLTYKCNAGCHFCPAPFRDDRISSSFWNNKEEILSNLGKTAFKGISFSGGDPFLVFERLLEWQAYFKKNLPGYYYWVYTNGLAVTEEKMRRLSAAGMNEIRFNIAATGYINQDIWNKIEAARKIFPVVSVEIPSIAKDFGLLETALDKMERTRINLLNLHDYILNDADVKSESLQSFEFILNKVIPLKYAVSSVENTERIIKLTQKKGYSFVINHCSMQQKELQMVQRRFKMGKLFNNPDYDLVLPDGTICNFYSVPETMTSFEFQMRSAKPDFRGRYSSFMLKINDPVINEDSGDGFIKVFYIPQMGTDQDKIYLRTEAGQVEKI